VWILTLFGFAWTSWAEISLGIDMGFLQEQNSLSSKSLTQSTITDFYLLVVTGRGSAFSFGLDYLYISSQGPSPTDDQKNAFTSMSPMASMRIAPGKRKIYSLMLSYGPIVQASFQKTGHSPDLWTGSATALKLNAQPEIYNSLYLSLSLLYFSASYTAKSQNSGSTNASGLNRTVIAPLIGLRYDF
jgi:hypothetical protein